MLSWALVIVVAFVSLSVQQSSPNSVACDVTSVKMGPMGSGECRPRHVHLSFGDTVTDFTVLWVTARECGCCQVKYGRFKSHLTWTAPAQYKRFVDKNQLGLSHYYSAILTDLSPGVTYFYQAECWNTTSKQFSFRVPSFTQSTEAAFLVYGDMGVESQCVQEVVREAKSGLYTAIIHVGDIAYDLHSDGGRVGDKFMELIEPAASSVPYLTCPGNHESYADFTHYRHRFHMPGSSWPMSVDKLWYSLDIGLVHFVSYSTEVFFTDDGRHVEAQRKWLIDDLKSASANKNHTPWIVACGHRPLYCSASNGDDCHRHYSYVRNGLEDIFYKYNVDIVLQGHEHYYERLWPVYQEDVTDRSYINVASPIQIISGAAGSREGLDPLRKDDQPDWSDFRLGDGALSSYGRLRVFNASHILWQQRSALRHTLIDEIWIVKTQTVARNRKARPRPGPPTKCGLGCIISILVTCAVAVFVVVGALGRMRRTRPKYRKIETQEEMTPTVSENKLTEIPDMIA